MKTEHTYRWMTRWAGKMSPTRFHATEYYKNCADLASASEWGGLSGSNDSA